MLSCNLDAAFTVLWWVKPTDPPGKRGYSSFMNWGTIIFVLVAVAQGYAKWRKKQADEAKRAEATAAKKNVTRQAEWQKLQADSSDQPVPAVDEPTPAPNAGSPWMPGDRDPERGGERLLAQARNTQARADIGGSAPADVPVEPLAGGPSGAKGPIKSSREPDVDLILKGFGLDAGETTISSNARIEDLEEELNVLRQRQSTLLRNWKKLRDERDALAMQLERANLAPVAAGGQPASQGLVDRLRSPLGAREAFVVAEILGPPAGSKRSGA